MIGDDTDWRFGKTKLDAAYSGMDRGYNSGTGRLAPLPLNGSNGTNRTNITAASRIIPSPSNTNWNSTFVNNNAASPSGTDWKKAFGQTSKIGGQRSVAGGTPATTAAARPFSFDLSPAGDRGGLSLTNAPVAQTETSEFFRDRFANADVTSRDHELYGAGKDYGFTF